MFGRLISDAKAAAGAVIVKYVARASVALPFLIAVGFAVAAITVMLADRFGALIAYWMLAGGFTAVGLVAALVVTVKEQEEEAVEAEAEAKDTSSVAAEAALQAPLALLGGLLTSGPIGPGSLLGLGRQLARNLPLILLLVLIGVLLWPSETVAAEEGDLETGDTDPDVIKPNGVYPSGNEARN